MKILLLFDPASQGSGGSIRINRMRRAIIHLGLQPICLSLDRSDSFLHTLASMEPPDLVFSSVGSLSRGPKESIDIHAVLERQGIPFVGSSAEVLQLVLSKVALKEQWIDGAVPTPGFWPVRTRADLDLLQGRLGSSEFPMIVKPATEGNSRGITDDSVAHDQEDLEAIVEETLSVYGEAMVEQFLGHHEGVREFTVALVGSGPQGLILPAELVLKRSARNRVITTKDKEQGLVETRPVEDLILRSSLVEMASRAFQVAGVRDYARCDFLLANDQLMALEINGQPMIPDPWFGACASGVGLSESQYLAAILLSSIHRQRESASPPQHLPVVFEQVLPNWIFEQLTLLKTSA